MINKAFLAFTVLTLSIMNWGNTAYSTPSIVQKAANIQAQATSINPEVLALALQAYSSAREDGLDEQGLLTVIDYSKPSNEPRMWVIDVKNDQIVYHLHVSHGKNSGKLKATKFSNKPGSRQSSIGLYLTGATYNGHHGLSLRLKGLEKGYNDNAFKRAIVIHGAEYAKPEFAKKFGRLGLSWGCPAVDTGVSTELIKKIKGGTLVFAYYPQNKWLQHSNYLHDQQTKFFV